MSGTKVVGVVLAGVLLAVAIAGARPFDKRTHFTFSGPVAIPGVTLPAGEYIFRLVDTSSRNVIQALSANGQQSYAMFFGRHALRTDIPTEPELRFMETAAGMPRAVESWWYPGVRSGYEFVYPRERARLLAMGTGRPVLTTAAEELAAELEVPEWVWMEPEGTEVAVEPPARGPRAVLEGEIAPQVTEIPESLPPALPTTASPLARVGFGAFALILGAALIRVWRVAR
jgi:hypothetical protein